MAIRQRATALYLIDKLALRAGNEKGEDEADTVGCCSLRYEHITLELPNLVVFDFLGKDSMRYYNSVPVDDQVFKNLKLFKKEPKTDGDSLFDRLSTPLLNKYLGELMPGLTAKVFRTFNASFVFQQELIKTGDGAVAEKILAYNRANRQVAILCNHQRSVGKAHGAQIGKMQDKLNFFKYERYLVRNAMIKDDPKLKKTLEELDVFDEEEKTYIVNAMLKTDLDKIKTKIVKANDKIKKGEDTEGVLTSDADIEKLLKEKEDEVGVYIIKEKIEKMDSEKLFFINID